MQGIAAIPDSPPGLRDQVNADWTAMGAEAFRARLAEILSVAAESISVRGTSSNGLGFPGRKEGVAAVAIVLLDRNR